VSGNVITGLDGASTKAIYIDDCDGGGVVSGNHIADAKTGIELDGTSTDLAVSGNTIVDCADFGILVTACNNLALTSNVVTGISASGNNTMKFVLGTDIVVSGNMLERDDDQDDNLLLAGTGAGSVSNISIIGNVFQNGDYGVGEPTDANNTNVIVMGNRFSGMNTGNFEQAVDCDVAADDHNA
jgi:parallel beta-helix repeat protein